MTTTETRFFATADRIRAIHDQFPDSIDPDFDDSQLADLEYQFGELRMALCN